MDIKELNKKYRELRHKKNRTEDEQFLLQRLRIVCNSAHIKTNLI